LQARGELVRKVRSVVGGKPDCNPDRGSSVFRFCRIDGAGFHARLKVAKRSSHPQALRLNMQQSIEDLIDWSVTCVHPLGRLTVHRLWFGNREYRPWAVDVALGDKA
jgi:hypothetical protein